MDTDTHPIESPLSHLSIHLQNEPSIFYTESPFAPPPPTAHANETGNAPSGIMDEAMDDDTKDLGPFQQRGTPAADSEDAVIESTDEAMDRTLHPQPAEHHLGALCPEDHITNTPTATQKPPQPQQTKAQKKNQRRARKLQG